MRSWSRTSCHNLWSNHRAKRKVILSRNFSNRLNNSVVYVRAKALAEAADLSLVLGTDELVALGVKGVEGFVDGDLAYGYCFHKHHQRNRTLWTISRALIQRELPPIKALPKQVGFGMGVEACLDLTPVGVGSHIFAINSL